MRGTSAGPVALLGGLFLLLSCADSGAPAQFRVGLLTPGSVNDGGWNQGAYEGLRRIEATLGAAVSHVETKTPAEFEAAFRGYAADGYALLFGHGFEYQEAAARVAADYPDTIFITTSGNTVRENLAPMVFELEQATYLCGFLAARLSRSELLGMVGGIDLPSIRSTFLAFRGGARRANPEIEVREVFIGNFDDTASAKEAALALLAQGADFLIHQANDAGRGVFQAVEEFASDDPVYACGTNRDQSDLAPRVVLASATLDLPAAFEDVARRVAEGAFVAEPLSLGMREGVVDFVWNPRLEGAVAAEIRDELAQLEDRIRRGEFRVPRAAELSAR